MKITKRQLKQLIKKEHGRQLNEYGVIDTASRVESDISMFKGDVWERPDRYTEEEIFEAVKSFIDMGIYGVQEETSDLVDEDTFVRALRAVAQEY